MSLPPQLSEHAVTEAEREFLYQVGVAITEWANIDQASFKVCASVLKAKERHVAIVYYRTPTLRARLDLVDELMKTMLPPKKQPNGGKDHPETKEWTKLVSDIANALHVRNQLAHAPSAPWIEIGDKPDGKPGVIDEWWASYKGEPERLRGREGDLKELKIADIKNHAHEVGQLWIRFRNIRHNGRNRPRVADPGERADPGGETEEEN